MTWPLAQVRKINESSTNIPLIGAGKMNVNLNVRELLNFYDFERTARRHSNSIKTLAGEEVAIALLIKFLDTRGLQPKLLDTACTTKGAWLDAWLSIQENCEEIHFQVEVKTWSFHGYAGGDELRVDCGIDELVDFKKKEWKRYWNDDTRRFKDPKVDKVLKRMNSTYQGEIRPLACLWAAVHPDGKDDECFVIQNVADEHFKKLWVFSVSSYLRNYLKDKRNPGYIKLALPDTAERIDILNKIFV
ncbi:MAG: hypothetical protein V4488_02760 [Pseudomonadota bacterium]